MTSNILLPGNRLVCFQAQSTIGKGLIPSAVAADICVRIASFMKDV